MQNTNLDLTSAPFYFTVFFCFFFRASAPWPPRLLSLSLQQMALVRGGQVTDDPVTLLRAPEPCPAPPVPPPSPSLSRHQPPAPLSPSPLNTSSPFCSSISPSTPPFNPSLLLSVSPPFSPPPFSSPLGCIWLASFPLLPPVVQAFWTEQMVREDQEETSSNLGAQPDLAHSECLMPA